MGPQPLAEDNLPKDDGDTSEEELPRIPGGTFVGGMRGDDVGTSDEEPDERVEVGGYQLLNADVDVDVAGDDESDESGDDDDEPNVNAGWARFEEMSANADSQTDSRLDADWPIVGSGGVTTGSNTLSLGSDGVTTDSTALPHLPSDSEFLVGGAHLLPSNLRDVPLPRVASLSEGVRQVWAGKRAAEAGEASAKSMGKVDDIRKAMATITLPNNAVPEWASQLSDEDWRKALDERLNLSKK